MHQLAQCASRNKVVVTIANKPARIAWAVLTSGQDIAISHCRSLPSDAAVEKPLRGMGGITAQQNVEATLVVSLYDVKQKELVWRGITKNTLNSPRSPDERRTLGRAKSCTPPLLGAITHCKGPIVSRKTTASRRASPCCSTSTRPRKQIASSTPSQRAELCKFRCRRRSGPYGSACSLIDSARLGRSTAENRLDRIFDCREIITKVILSTTE